MRRFFVNTLLGAALLSSSAAAAEMTGWISDSTCGAGNASSKESARECAQRCLEGGAEAVFVSEADQKVYKLSDQVEAKKHVKGKVKVTGTVSGDKLTISKIEPVKS
jgi:hypothetical protein